MYVLIYNIFILKNTNYIILIKRNFKILEHILCEYQNIIKICIHNNKFVFSCNLTLTKKK